MRIAVAALAMAALSCGSTTAVPPSVTARPRLQSTFIHGDVRFDAGERALVERALGDLTTFTGGKLRLSVIWDWREDNFELFEPLPHLVKRSPKTPKVQDVDDHTHGRTLAFVDGSEIAIVTERTQPRYAIILHELGHFVGLEHVDATLAVMAPVPTSTTFTSADRAECIRIKLCE